MKEWCFEHPILTFLIIITIALELECYITYLNNRLKVKLLTLENKKEENKNKYTTYGSDGKIKHNI
jgi:hypothetical protein